MIEQIRQQIKMIEESANQPATFAYANELSESAERAGAANCLKFDGDRIIAENFDGIGLVRDITVNLGVKVTYIYPDQLTIPNQVQKIEEAIAAKARNLIEVEYEDLPVVCDVVRPTFLIVCPT